jgi:hypothetical protein
MPIQSQAGRPSRWRRVVLLVAAAAAVALAGVVWYTLHFSMAKARSYEVAGGASGPQVLIATQGSAFKDAVVAGLVERLKARSAHIQVIDVGMLAGVRETQWDAIVVVHTWQMGKPPAEVRTFAERMRDREKLAVLTTSGAGSFKLQGVDAVSAASSLADVPERVHELLDRVDRILARRPMQ